MSIGISDPSLGRCEKVACLAAEEALSRSAIYSFLGEMYCTKPSEGLLECLVAGDLLGALGDFEGVHPYVEVIKDRVGRLDRSVLEEEISVEFTRLFVGPGDGFVRPYESVFRDWKTIEYCGCADAGLPPSTKTVAGLLWGDSTVAVEQCYREAGFELTADWRGTPDHVGLELQFMGELCKRESEAWQVGDGAGVVIWVGKQRQFLDEHLDKWLGDFCARVMGLAQHPFYLAMAMVTAEVLQNEVTTLANRGQYTGDARE